MFKLPPGEKFLTDPRYYDHQKGLYYDAIAHCTRFRKAIDVGAHVGFFSAKMVNDFQEVHAFEPMFFEYLKENVKADNLIVYPLGLSSETKEYKFNIRPHHTGMSKIDESGQHQISCIDLDSKKFREVDLIKIDVEYHERFVIDGMKQFLKHNDPVIIIELNDQKQKGKILEILHSCGYDVVKQVSSDFILKHG